MPNSIGGEESGIVTNLGQFRYPLFTILQGRFGEDFYQSLLISAEVSGWSVKHIGQSGVYRLKQDRVAKWGD